VLAVAKATMTMNKKHDKTKVGVCMPKIRRSSLFSGSVAGGPGSLCWKWPYSLL
jgi:hypothetical protein